MVIEKSEKDAQNWIEVELKKLNVRLDKKHTYEK